jgi:hypothetical protein
LRDETTSCNEAWVFLSTAFGVVGFTWLTAWSGVGLDLKLDSNTQLNFSIWL